MILELGSKTKSTRITPSRNMVFKPVVVGGQDVTSLRAHFDHDDRNIIVVSSQQLLYYDVNTGEQNGVANIAPTKLEPNEYIVACDKLESSLYVFTNFGKVFIWSLEARDWINELNLPIEPENEHLVSCKMLSKRQYIFTSKEFSTDTVKLYISTTRSERERPKNWESIGECGTGLETDFDIGWATTQYELDEANKTTREKLLKQRTLVFIKSNQIFFQKIGIGEKLEINLSRQYIANHDFTCVRANPKRPMVAAGDALGRIYLYSGGFSAKRPWPNRTKLHWHTNSVSDLCFSNTGQTLYSVGGEAGCVVMWDLSDDKIGQRRVVPKLGMPIRHVNCSDHLQRVVLSFEDNEIIYMDMDDSTKSLRTLTKRTYDMFLKADHKALRDNYNLLNTEGRRYTLGLQWHSKSDSIVTNSKPGVLQFYSPRLRKRIDTLDVLKTEILTIVRGEKVTPSEITRAVFTTDGDWLAFYETREIPNLFPEVRLHIWRRSTTMNRWYWVQTADRLHSTATITDLKFSPDGQYLVSVGDDGVFHILHRVCLDAKSPNKQMYAKGVFGNVPPNMASLAAFSQDSSVIAISLKNGTTLIWMIDDPYKLTFEFQLNQGGSVDSTIANGMYDDEVPSHDDSPCEVLGLHFGQYEPSKSIAPLCEVRQKVIRVWNILQAHMGSDVKLAEFFASDNDNDDQDEEFTAAAFSHVNGSNSNHEHFAVSSKKNSIYIFDLKVNTESRVLQPLVIIDGTLPQTSPASQRYYTNMCFLNNPILDIDTQCHQDATLLKLINRLTLLTNKQELVSFTDRLTLERQSAINSCNAINSYEINDIQAYLTEQTSTYRDEIRETAVLDNKQTTPKMITEKQRKIKHKLEVQRMIKDLFQRVPTHTLPKIEELGPMILDKLVIS